MKVILEISSEHLSREKIFRMKLYAGQKTLKINSNNRSVQWTNFSAKRRETPGELTSAQWRHLKLEPSHLAVTDIEKNIGKLMTYQALRESFAELVGYKKPHQTKIESNGIQGTSEVIAYDFTKKYLDQQLCLSHLSPIENLVMVIVKKQLKSDPIPDYRSSKAVFINELMIPRWQCTLFSLTPGTKVQDLWNIIDSLMKQFLILDLKITMKRIEESSDQSKIYLELWTKVVKKKAIGDFKFTGLYDSRYPKVTCTL